MKTWLSWNGKRAQSESCKHGKKGKSSESSKNRERRVRSKGCKHGKRLTTKPQSIKKAFSSSFAGALRAPAQRFELGLRLERLSRGRSQRIASNKEKSFENGSKMPPRRLQKRSKIAPRWLPGAPPESANESGHLFCSFFSSLGRLLGLSWGAPGGSWGGLGASWAAPGRSWGAFSPPGGLLLEPFGPPF